MLSLVCLLTLQWAVATYAIGRLVEGQVAGRLQHEGESLLASVQFSLDGVPKIADGRLGLTYNRPFSGHYYVVLAGKQRLVSRSLWDEDLPVEALAPGSWQRIRVFGPQSQPLLAVAQGFEKQGHQVTVVVAEDLTEVNSGVTRFQLLYATVSAAGLILLLMVQRFIVLNALRPLANVREDMSRLGRGETDHVAVQGPEEIRPLIEELNRLLIGMERRTRRSREALGNLAHALKTRLTLLNQTAERPELDSNPQVRSSINASTVAIGGIVERELKRARLLGDMRPGRRVDLHVELAQLVHTLHQLYAAKGVNIAWEVARDALFLGDREDLLEMLGNLLDNACKWCTKRVSLTITGNETLSFVVEDDGPGCPVRELSALTLRGYKGDESAMGSGLGLAIVNDIVESYDGRLSFDRSAALGGLRVEVSLPRRA
jgi:signal transduction histidine kinase